MSRAPVLPWNRYTGNSPHYEWEVRLAAPFSSMMLYRTKDDDLQLYFGGCGTHIRGTDLEEVMRASEYYLLERLEQKKASYEEELSKLNELYMTLLRGGK